MRKKRVIVLFVIFFLIISYFAGGIIASNIVLSNIFEKRGSNESDLLTNELLIYKTRNDYSIMNERIEYDFYSSNNKLKGYYYRVNDSKGLVISAHGMKSLSDAKDAEYQSYFIEQGYSVFAIDLTASGKSEGKSMNGLYQSAYDIKAAYDFLKEGNMLEDKLILVGHSWGAYGACASIALGLNPDYVISFSAFDNPYDTMVRFSLNSVGGIIYPTIPTFYLATNIKYGKNNTLSASKALKNSKAKSLVIQGKNDKTIPYNKEALYNHVKNLSNVKTLLLDNIGHNNPWLSYDSIKYVEDEIEPKLKTLSGSELDNFIKNVDKEKTSALSNIVFDEIKDFLK